MMTPTPPVKMPVAHTASAADPIRTAVAPWMAASACGIAINSGSPGGYVGTWYDDPAGRHPSGVVSHGSEPCRTSASGLRSEEHTSELQSPCNLVCRLLLVKKNSSNLSKQYF